MNINLIHDELIRNNLLTHDSYFILKDFDSYVKAHEKATELYKDQKKFTAVSIMNVAKSAYFSSDRTITDYNNDIWHLKPIKND